MKKEEKIIQPKKSVEDNKEVKVESKKTKRKVIVDMAYQE